MIGRAPAEMQNGFSFKAFILLFVESISFSLEVFLRRDFGCRYIGRKALLATWLILGFAECWTGYPVQSLHAFALVYSLFATYAWSRARIRLLRGDTAHSRYSGWPRYLRRHLHARETPIKKYFEPFAVLCIGLMICDNDRVLAMYLALASFCLFLTARRSDNWVRRRVLDVNDAIVEQQHVSARFQALRGQW